MRQRCNNQRHPQFPDYGGRGVTIAAEWATFAGFAAWAYSAGYESHLSIERVDVNGDYRPDNCIWGTAVEQSRNRRFVARREDGTPWCEVAASNGIPVRVYNGRVYSGWTHARAATEPVGHRSRGHAK